VKTLLTVNKITTYLPECIALFDRIDGVKTIRDFINKVESLSLKYQDIKIPNEKNEKLNSFKGDMLEILGEIFFSVFSADPAVGLADYIPVPLSEDYGVDGIGINVNGDKCAVQMKYRANPLELILYSDIAKTYAAGKLTHNLPLDKNNTIFLFTTGNTITAACEAIFGKIIRVINRNIIAGKIDNNQNFWLQAERLIMDTLDNT
jgi:glycyl-tRNA synthetase alpha subunit